MYKEMYQVYKEAFQIYHSFCILFDTDLKHEDILEDDGNFPEIEGQQSVEFKRNHHWKRLDKLDFDDLNDSPSTKFQDAFSNDYRIACQSKTFFYCCQLEAYKTQYPIMLSDYKLQFPDAEVISFISQELKRHVNPIEQHYFYSLASEENRLNLNFSRTATLKFLGNEARKENFEVIFEDDFFNDSFSFELKAMAINNTSFSNITNIQWQGSQTDLIELIKSLIENGAVKGIQKDIINSFTSFFEIEIKNPDKLITDIKKRNIGSETLFIDKLKKSLYDYITKEKTR